MVHISNRSPRESKLVSVVSAAAKEPINGGLTDSTEQYLQYQYTTNVAVIFGVTGLVGRELAKRLSSRPRWKVYGIARFPTETRPVQTPNYTFISCDLLNPNETKQKLSFIRDVTHVFWVTWASHFPLDSPECSDQNTAMLSNALNAILPAAKSLKHLSLQTGLKHYAPIQGPSNEHGIGQVYDEESPRVNSGYNFYYALEDLLKQKLSPGNNNSNNKLGWSVHRPGLLLGSSNRTVFNFMGSLCVYAAICKHLSLPFMFGGKRECWEEFWIDGSDARLVAEQHIWAATSEEISAIDGQAFNSINGTSFTWKEIWPVVGNKFGVGVPENMFSEEFRLAEVMRGKEGVWEEIVEKEGLVQTSMEDLANWEFLDVLFRCPVKLLGSREKADKLGFTTRCKTVDSILYWVDFMRDEKYIP